MSDTFDDGGSGAVPGAAAVAPPFDPLTAEPIGHAPGRAIPVASYGAERLRRVFADPRPWVPETTDERRAPRFRRGANDYVPASVLLPVVLRDDGPTMLFTERTAHLNAHAGQVSFPGGRAEPGDADAAETALRETEEEIGLARAHVEVVGRLVDYLTVTGFRVAPIVALVRPPFTLALDAFEVASAFEVPLAFLLDPANHERRRARMPTGEVRRFTAITHGGHCIWGATAAMLRDFYLFLAAQDAGADDGPRP